MDDAGQYQCLAENEMGATEKVVMLVLQSESRPPLSGPWVGTLCCGHSGGVWAAAMAGTAPAV